MQKQQQGKEGMQAQMERLKLGEERKHLTPGGSEDPWFESSQSQDDLKSNQQGDLTIRIEEKVVQGAQGVAKNSQKMESDKQEQKMSDYKSFDHSVDHKYIILLKVMDFRKLISLRDISGLKKGYIDFYIKQSKISVKTANQQDAKAAISKISDYIDNLNIQKLNIFGQAAMHLSNFRKLKQIFRKLKVIIFGYTAEKSTPQLLIGGQMKPSQLKLHVHNLKSYKIHSFTLRAIQSTRTYRIMIEEMLEMREMKQALANNQINLCQVQQHQKNKHRNLRIILTSSGKKQFTPSQYEDFLMKQIKNYYVVVVILNIYPQYFEKLVSETIHVKYVREQRFQRSELIILGHRDNFIKNKTLIQQYLQKIDQNIIGLRYFNHINPSIRNIQINRQKYYFYGFPLERPYSTYVHKNRSFEQAGFDWKSLYEETLNSSVQRHLKQQEA